MSSLIKYLKLVDELNAKPFPQRITA